VIRAIFFDFDGVLIDSEPLHLECWAEVLTAHGIPLSPSQYAADFIGVSNRAMIETLCRQFRKPYSPAFFTARYREKMELYQRRAGMACRVPQDLVAFIKEVVNFYRLAVVSSSSRSEVEPFLVRAGIHAGLQAVVCAEDVQNYKPAPDPYLKAMEMVNCGSEEQLRAEECLVVEDSEPGAEAGRRAGMRVLRVCGPDTVERLLRAELGRHA